MESRITFVNMTGKRWFQGMNRSSWASRGLVVLFALSMLIFTGCAVPFQKKLNAYVANNEFDKAAELIQSEKKEPKENIYNEKNELIYLMDMGAVKQMAGDYKASSSYLTKAEDKIEELYTRSALDETYSFLSSDLSLKYTGTEPEQVMVNVLMALNYMYQEKWADAQIEAKRLDSRMNVIADKLGDKAFYSDDGFMRYLAGYCYEAMGEINNAYISYKKSLAAYAAMNREFKISSPDTLKMDLLRTSQALGFTDEYNSYYAQFGGISFYPQSTFEKLGEVMFVIYDGLPPYITDSNGSPVYNRMPPAIVSAKVMYGNKLLDVPVAQDIQELQIKMHERRWGERLLKGIGSSVAKSLAKNVPGLSLFVGKDQADTRSWKTLPGKFRVIRLPFNPGANKISLQVVNKAGDTINYDIKFDIKAGAKKAIPFYVYNDGTIEPYVEKK